MNHNKSKIGIRSSLRCMSPSPCEIHIISYVRDWKKCSSILAMTLEAKSVLPATYKEIIHSLGFIMNAWSTIILPGAFQFSGLILLRLFLWGFFIKIYHSPYYFLFFWILASDSLRSLVTSFLSLRLVFSWNDKQRKGCDQSRTAKYPSEWRSNAEISAFTWRRRHSIRHTIVFIVFLFPVVMTFYCDVYCVFYTK